MMAVSTIVELSELIEKAAHRRIALWSKADGAVALIRTPDGQAYEVEMRPASLAKFTPFFRYTHK